MKRVIPLHQTDVNKNFNNTKIDYNNLSQQKDAISLSEDLGKPEEKTDERKKNNE